MSVGLEESEALPCAIFVVPLISPARCHLFMIHLLPNRLLLSALLLLAPIMLAAQWAPTGGPIKKDREIVDIEILGDYVWLSDDAHYTMPLDGDRWTNKGFGAQTGTYMTTAGDRILVSWRERIIRYDSAGTQVGGLSVPTSIISALESFTGVLFLGTLGRIYVFSDSGRAYQESSIGLPQSYVRSFAETRTGVLAGTDSGLYRSNDTGRNWRPVTMGLPPGLEVFQIENAGATVLVATKQGLYSSIDGGTTWAGNSTAFVGDTINVLRHHDGMVFAGGNHGLYRSNDAGVTWRFVGLDSIRITGLAVSSSYIFAGSSSTGVYRSTNSGRTWKNIRNGLGSAVVHDVIAFKGLLLAGGAEGVWRSSDRGETWELGAGAAMTDIHQLAVSSSAALAVSPTGLYSSPDGIAWECIDSSIVWLRLPGIAQLHEHKGRVFVASGWQGRALYRLEGPDWTRIDPRLYDTNRFFHVASYGDSLVAVGNDGVYFSTDAGDNWLPLGIGLPTPTRNVGTVFTIGRMMYVSLDSGLYRSTSAGASWERISDIATIYDTELVHNGKLYAYVESRLQVSADSGRTWALTDEKVEGHIKEGLAAIGNDLFLGVAVSDFAFTPYEGRGVWKMSLDSPPIAHVQHDASPVSSLVLLPNPSSGSTTLSFALTSAADIAIEVHGLDGRRVRRIDRGMMAAGEHAVPIAELPAGAYHVSIGCSSSMLIIIKQ